MPASIRLPAIVGHGSTCVAFFESHGRQCVLSALRGSLRGGSIVHAAKIQLLKETQHTVVPLHDWNVKSRGSLNVPIPKHCGTLFLVPHCCVWVLEPSGESTAQAVPLHYNCVRTLGSYLAVMFNTPPSKLGNDFPKSELVSKLLSLRKTNCKTLCSFTSSQTVQSTRVPLQGRYCCTKVPVTSQRQNKSK